MATLNAKCMLQREPNHQSMESVDYYCNTETGERLNRYRPISVTYINYTNVCRCSCMGSMSVSSCICCMFVSCVHPVAVLNVALCMTCSI